MFIVLTKSATARLFGGLGRLRGRWTLYFALGALFSHFLLGDRGKGQDFAAGGGHLRHIDLVGGGCQSSLLKGSRYGKTIRPYGILFSRKCM